MPHQRSYPQPVVKDQAFQTVQDLLLKSEARIAAVLPKHLTPERMIRVALTTVQQNPRILLCSPLSIIGTIVQASELGLELNGFLGEAYIVPYWNEKTGHLEAQFQAGYRGLIALARRSGLVSTIRPELVYHGDVFEIQTGTDPRIEHKPDYDNPTRGSLDAQGNMTGLRGAYAVVKYADGEVDFEYLPLTRLDELRDMSKARDKQGNEVGPWTKHPGEMYRKVPIRQLAKRLPLSPEFLKAAVLDEYGEAGVRQNLSSIIEGDRENFADVLASVAAQRTDELAEKYVRQQPPAARQAAPHAESARPPQSDEPPIEAYADLDPAPHRSRAPFRPSNADVSYGQHFASPPRTRARSSR